MFCSTALSVKNNYDAEKKNKMKKTQNVLKGPYLFDLSAVRNKKLFCGFLHSAAIFC